MMTSAAAEEDFAIRDVWVFHSDRGYAVQADLTVKKTKKLQEILKSGININLKFELHFIQQNDWWLDKTLVDIVWMPTISYDSLLKRYVFANGDDRYEHHQLEKVLERVGRLRSKPDDLIARVVAVENISISAIFEIEIKSLPQPIQVDLLTSNEWDISSGWKFFSLDLRT